MAATLYACPVLDCSRTSVTVKYLVDHLALFHCDAASAVTFSCGIDDCKFLSSSTEGYGMHLRREHSEAWNHQRYKRSAASSPGAEPLIKRMGLGSMPLADCDFQCNGEEEEALH